MCTDCQPSGPVVSFPPVKASPCNNCDNKECAGGIHSTDCIYYQGPDLGCLQAIDQDRLSVILQKIDEQLCHSAGGIQLGNIFCLAPLDNFDSWVTKISEKYCTLNSDFIQFRATTFPQTITSLDQKMDTLNKPALTSCDKLGIRDSDNIKTVLAKLSSGYCHILSEDLNISDLSWPACFKLNDPPAVIKDGLKAIADKVCVIESLLTANPDSGITFDNTSSCLPAPGPNDSLATTITKIKSRLCQTPTFNAGTISAGCTLITSADTLEQVMDKTIFTLSALKRNCIVAVNSSQFTLTPVVATDPCSGKMLSLNASISDRKVAATAGDTSPGTLSEKIIAGPGISISTDTEPGKLMIFSQVTEQDHKVATNGDDDNPDYLLAKLKGTTDPLCTVTITESSGQAQVAAQVNVEGVLEAIFELLETDEILRNRLCSLLTKCPSPCAPPTNVQAIPIP